MKEPYTPLTIEVIKFQSEDIITDSQTRNGGTLPDDGTPWTPLKPVP